MKRQQTLLLLICGVLAGSVSADEAREQAIAAFYRDAQLCKTSEHQQIVSDLVKVPGKPVSEPATEEELASMEEVKSILAKTGVPYDPANHRATYEATLAMLRVQNMAVFKVSSSNSADDLSAARECLGRLATESGVEFRFE